MTPCVDRNLMLAHVLALEHYRMLIYAGSDDEESRLEFLFIKVIDQVGCIWRRPIIVSQTPVQSGRTLGNITGTIASTARPPASRGISCRCRIRCPASCSYIGQDDS